MFVDVEALAGAYRAAGLTVHILDGADTRAARMFRKLGYPTGPQGSDKHHTAQPETWSDAHSIRYLSGEIHPSGWVMCNVYPHKDEPGVITIVAAGPTYTAGSGGPVGNIPTNRGNRDLWSWECPNNGTNEPWPDHIIETIVIGAAVEAQFFGWDVTPERIFCHFEWSNPGQSVDTAGFRKIDLAGWCKYSIPDAAYPGMWDMDAYRLDVELKRIELYETPATWPPPQPPTEEEDHMFIWKDKTPDGDNAEYLIGSGGVAHIDGKTRNALVAQGVLVIEGTNPEVSKSYRRVARGLPDDADA